jgi:segregation and condensation protein A
MLLEMLLNLINKSGTKDLRICGIAALSSSLIHRLKVESIFNLEKIAMQKKSIQEPSLQEPIPELEPLDLPYRIETSYPVSLDELLHVLENMISELANPRPKKKQLDLDPIQTIDFDQYLVKFEQILQEYESMIFDIVSADGIAIFKDLVLKMNSVETVRCFIAMLYLAMKGRVQIDQNDEVEDIVIRIVEYKQ